MTASFSVENYAKFKAWILGLQVQTPALPVLVGMYARVYLTLGLRALYL